MLADLSHAIDGELRTYKDQVTHDAYNADAMIANVSRAHLTALEAKLLFQPIDFLTMRDERQAKAGFRDYITSAAPQPGPNGILTMLIFTILGFIFGIGIGYNLFDPNSGALLSQLLETQAFPLSAYPQVGLAFFISLMIYAYAGLFSNSVIAALGPQAMASKGAANALNAVRSAFFAADAPTPDDIITHVETIAEILTLRLSSAPKKGQTKSAHQMNEAAYAPQDHAPQDIGGASFAEEDVPSWRRTKQGPRFVDTGFQSAPQSWRADPHLDLDGKNISRGSGAKRSLLSFKNTPRD